MQIKILIKHEKKKYNQQRKKTWAEYRMSRLNETEKSVFLSCIFQAFISPFSP